MLLKFTALASLLTGGAALWYALTSHEPPAAKPQFAGRFEKSADDQQAKSEDNRGKPQLDSPIDEAIAYLLHEDVDAELARTVVEAHAELLVGFVEPHSSEFKTACKFLSEVCLKPELEDALLKHPEAAGLLYTCREPARMARLIEQACEADIGVWLGVFSRLMDPEDVVAFEPIFYDHHDLITELTRRGYAGVEALFAPQAVTPPGKVASRLYRRWLAAELQTAVSHGDDDRLSSVMVYANVEGGTILEKVADEDFRTDFPLRWKLLGDLLAKSHEDLIVAAGRPGIWEFLGRRDARDLWARGGSLAIELFDGEGHYPPEYHGRVAELLFDPSSPMTGFLAVGRSVPSVLQTIREFDLDRGQWELYAKDVLAFRDDPKKFADRVGALRRVYQNSRAGFLEEVGASETGWTQYLPGYDVYKYLDKTMDGRETSNMELFFAVTEVLTAPVPGGKLGTTLGKDTAKQAAREILEQSAKEGAKRIAKEGAKEFGRESVKLVAKELWRRAAKETVTAQGRRDITWLVRAAFDKSGLGRASFRRLTGLEARLFMRQDARIFFHVKFRTFGIQEAGGRVREAVPAADCILAVARAKSPEEACEVLECYGEEVVKDYVRQQTARLLLGAAMRLYDQPLPKRK